MSKVDTTTWHQLNVPLTGYAKKQMREAETLNLFLKIHNDKLGASHFRFGDDTLFEPDFLLKTSNGIVGVEVTDIYGSNEIAIAFHKKQDFEPATDEEWLKAIQTSYENKLSARKDGTHRYDRSTMTKLILIMHDKSKRATSSFQIRGIMPNGTPIMDITLFQQLFQPWSDVIDESYLLGRSTTNGIGAILIKGHLNISR